MRFLSIISPLLLACSSQPAGVVTGPETGVEDALPQPTVPTCAAGAGGADVTAPELTMVLANRWREAWLGSPAVADIDQDGENEIIVPRGDLLIAWNLDGTIEWGFEAEGRIWASPIVADIDADGALEAAFSARQSVYVLDGRGELQASMSWHDELRSIAAGQLDYDPQLELVVATTQGNPPDVIHAFNHHGTPLAGFPPFLSETAGCDETCVLAGCFDQNLAVGDLDGDGIDDIVAPHDNAYVSVHTGGGTAFAAADEFENTTWSTGVRYLHDPAEAAVGWAENEEAANQAHFTNTAPTIADIDGDGVRELILLGSAQNAAQTDRERGVGLWVVGPDGSRRPGFEWPVHVPDYLAGLWDFDGTNVVAATNQVSVANIDANAPGLEMVFAGFDGQIHAVSAAGEVLWSSRFTDADDVLCGGVVLADLSADGIPEVVFNTYSTRDSAGALFVLNAAGRLLHEVPLPRRGAMPVPTVDDVDGDGELEIIVSLKDAEDGVEAVQVYSVPGSETNCLPWPTGRGNYRRDGLRR